MGEEKKFDFYDFGVRCAQREMENLNRTRAILYKKYGPAAVNAFDAGVISLVPIFNQRDDYNLQWEKFKESELYGYGYQNQPPVTDDEGKSLF